MYCSQKYFYFIIHTGRMLKMLMTTLPSEMSVKFHYILLLVALNWLLANQQNNKPTFSWSTSPRYFSGLLITVSKWHCFLVPNSQPSADVSGMSARRGGFGQTLGGFCHLECWVRCLNRSTLRNFVQSTMLLRTEEVVLLSCLFPPAILHWAVVDKGTQMSKALA